jgi:hypothetical protein
MCPQSSPLRRWPTSLRSTSEKASNQSRSLTSKVRTSSLMRKYTQSLRSKFYFSSFLLLPEYASRRVSLFSFAPAGRVCAWGCTAVEDRQTPRSASPTVHSGQSLRRDVCCTISHQIAPSHSCLLFYVFLRMSNEHLLVECIPLP